MEKAKSKAGLTLIELIVTVGMLSLLMLIVLPKIDMSNYKLIEISKNLRDDIRYVRYIAMTEGDILRIFFQRNRYLILEGTKIIKEVRLDSNFSLYQNFKDNLIYFSYNGAPSTSGGTIDVVKSDGKYTEITVVPGTGRVLFKNQIYNGYKMK